MWSDHYFTLSTALRAAFLFCLLRQGAPEMFSLPPLCRLLFLLRYYYDNFENCSTNQLWQVRLEFSISTPRAEQFIFFHWYFIARQYKCPLPHVKNIDLSLDLVYKSFINTLRGRQGIAVATASGILRLRRRGNNATQYNSKKTCPA